MENAKMSTGVKDLTGQRFGRLVVTGYSHTNAGRKANWHALCDCGGTVIVVGESLRLGRTQSCGCMHRERTVEVHTKHGAAKRGLATPEYIVWRGMVDRCTNPNNPAFHHYGGRGIKVCDRWSDFAAFISDMGPRPTPKHTIERHNNDRGYSPDNCTWEPMAVQARNKRSSRPVVRDDGVVFGTMVEAAEASGVHPTGIRAACTGLQRTAGGHGWKFADTALLRALSARSP